MPDNATQLPTLPFEVIRRIIHFRLALPQIYPAPITPHAQYRPSWDSWTGARGREVESNMVAERRDVVRTAWGLVRVCKAWKAVVLQYLYASPNITTNLQQLTFSILKGDAKWSDINLHAFSLPGRHVTTLDLSHIPLEVHRTVVKQSCLALFPLLPNVTHLKLGERETKCIPFGEIGWAAFAKMLKCLEGVWVDEREGMGRELVRLLKKLPNLEVLGVVGPGISVEPDETSDQRPLQLSLPKLHTFKMEGVPSGDLVSTLLTASLPSLTHLILTPTPLMPFDQSLTLQTTLGPQIRSLTYLPPRGWPRADTSIPPDTLDIHPELIHLACLDGDFEGLDVLLRSPASTNHPLRVLTVPKWSPSCNSSDLFTSPPVAPSNLFPSHLLTPPPSPPHQSSTDASLPGPPFLRTLCSRSSTHPAHPGQTRSGPNIKVIVIDGFKWVKPTLGQAAMRAGQSGEMRYWSGVLARKGIQLYDMEGETAPPVGNQSSAGYVTGGKAGGRRKSSNSVMNFGMGMRGRSSTPREWGGCDEDGG
ncbi:hypothetical protein C365_03894 [Cryptococcus neoformans Bt85]|nr:hypothetical protein C365_03894 [Cryptococcus neoformans var. grubii Bt85]